MGEERNRVFNFGSLAIENIKNLKKINKIELFKNLKINPKIPFVILTYHPITLGKKNSTLNQITNILKALKRYNLQIVATAPGHEKGRNIIDSFIIKNSKKNIERYLDKESPGAAKLWYKVMIDGIAKWQFCIRGKNHLSGGSMQVLEFTKINHNA